MLEAALAPISELEACGSPPSTDVLAELSQLEILKQWEDLAQKAVQLLSSTSKDLGITEKLLKAEVQLRGFAGADAGLRVALELLKSYWDTLHPRDYRRRMSSPLWVFLSPGNERPAANNSVPTSEDLFHLLSTLPLTAPQDGSPGLNFRDWQMARSNGSLDHWTASVRSTPNALYVELNERLTSIRKSLAGVIATLREHVEKDEDPIIIEYLQDGKKRLDEYVSLVEQSRLQATTETAAPVAEFEQPRPDRTCDAEPSNRPSVPDTVLSAIYGARKQWPQGLEQISAIAAGTVRGRDIFARNFELAKLYIDKGHLSIASVILEALNKQIEYHHLAEWEGGSFVADVWVLLCRCREEESKKKEAAELRDELYRMAPWRALEAAPRSTNK